MPPTNPTTEMFDRFAKHATDAAVRIAGSLEAVEAVERHFEQNPTPETARLLGELADPARHDAAFTALHDHYRIATGQPARDAREYHALAQRAASGDEGARARVVATPLETIRSWGG